MEGPLLFNHLTIDPTTGRLYAGAVNRLLQLDSNLNLEEYVSTGEINLLLILDIFQHRNKRSHLEIEKKYNDKLEI